MSKEIERQRLEAKAKKLGSLADKLLGSKLGQQIVGAKLGLSVFDDATPGRKTVLVCVPSYRGYHPWMRAALENLIHCTRPEHNVYVVATDQGKSVVHHARNDMAAQVVKDGKPYDYILYVDDDIVPEPDALLKMLAHDKDIVAALCTKRSHPALPNIRALHAESGNFVEMVDWANDGQLIEVDAAGTGMMLISKKVIDAVGEYYLSCGWEKDTLGELFVNSTALLPERDRIMVLASLSKKYDVISAARRAVFERTGNAFWFQFLPRPLDLAGENGEDITFCVKARQCGFPIYCDTAVTPGHMGEHAYSYHDFKPYQERYRAQLKKQEQAADDASGNSGPSGCVDGAPSQQTTGLETPVQHPPS